MVVLLKETENYKGVHIHWREDNGSYFIFEDLNPLIKHGLEEPISNGDIEELLLELFEEERIGEIEFDSESDAFGAESEDLELLKLLIDKISSITSEQIEDFLG